MSGQWTNLDLLAQKYAQKVMEGVQVTASQGQGAWQKVSSTLEGYGPCAYFLHLKVEASGFKEEPKQEKKLLWNLLYESRSLVRFMQGKGPVTPPTPANAANAIRYAAEAWSDAAALSEDLDKLLLTKQVLSVMLTYVRHEIKALPD